MNWIIYKVTNTINGKYYIGQTNQKLYKRWSNHKHDAFHQSRPGYKMLICQAIREFGIDIWRTEIIETNIETQDVADDREAFWIAIFCANHSKFGYNVEGGKGLISAQTKRKLSDSGLGKQFSKETREKLSKSLSKLTTEQKLEINDLYLTGNYSHHKLAQLFNVSKVTIWRTLTT